MLLDLAVEGGAGDLGAGVLPRFVQLDEAAAFRRRHGRFPATQLRFRNRHTFFGAPADGAREPVDMYAVCLEFEDTARATSNQMG